MTYDLFISHASEDKDELVEPLVAAIEDRGLSVWYDFREIQLGDDFRRKIDEGLAAARFGVVVVSPSFRKYWPEAELSALFTQERVFDEKRILPVVHALTPQEVATTWPLLSARAAAYSSAGPEVVADRIVAAVTGAGRSRPAGPSRLFGVPQSLSVQFVGREVEMARLEELLRATSVRVAASVEGLAGIGKTELALQLVHHLAGKGAFPGGIFWFDAENPDLSATWGGVIAEALGLPEGSVGGRARLAVRAVSQRNRPLLIVLDNVEQWSAHKPAPLPTGTHLRFLVTTRQRKLGGSLFQHVSLGFLEPEFAHQLLTSVAERDPESMPGVEALLEYFGGHALAVELAGAYLSEFPEETPESYLTKLRKGSPLEAEVTDLVRYQRTVSQAFETMWERLGQEARSAWRLAACFAPEAVSPELSEAVGLSVEARRHLRRLHLIETDHSGGWRMHRLTREFGQRAGTEAEHGAARAAFVAGCMTFCDDIELAEGFRLYLPNRAHLNAALEIAPEVLDLGEKDPLWAWLLNRIGTALHSAGDLAGAHKLLKQAVAVDIGKNNRSVATRGSDLGLVLQAQGELAGARKLLEQALAWGLENLGEDHPEVAVSQSNLAAVLQAQGELAGARKLLEKALASGLKNFGEDDRSVLICRSILGLVLQGEGDLAGARELLEKALASALKNFDGDHRDVVTARANLCLVLQAQGELDLAEAEVRAALDSVDRQPEGSYVRVHVERVARGILKAD